MFSVRTAYKLGAQLKQQGEPASSSICEADNRSIWDYIWKAEVPEKVRIFAWRVATETLPTKKNKWKRTLEVDNICNICGRETEDEFHAVVSCSKAKALRNEMMAAWELATEDEDQFRFTGNEWLQNLLGSCAAEVRRKLLLLFWRAWWLRDDSVHAKGRALIGQSVQFLVKYGEETGNSDNEATTQMDNRPDMLDGNLLCTERKKGKQVETIVIVSGVMKTNQ